MLKQSDIATIRRLAKAGMKQADIAEQFSCSRGCVSDIVTGRRHKGEGERPDPTNGRILDLEAEVSHLREELQQAGKKSKAQTRERGLFKAVVEELEARIKPFDALPPVYKPRAKKAITEHVVMHLSDGHHDQVVTAEESGGFETYDFPISCARAERYVDTVIEWTQDTIAPRFNFPVLHVFAYGDHTSGEIHGHGPRSYYRNQIKNSHAIGILHALMYRDLAPYFEQINVIYLSGNHGRRTTEKDYHGAQDNWDYLIAEFARCYCKDLGNVNFTIPNAFSVNVDVNGVGFNLSHGDDVRGNLGIPFYGMVRRQKGLIALGAAANAPRVRYYVMGHHHVAANLSDIDGELIVNGAWVGTDAYAYNRFAGYREPCQWFHGVNPHHGITWRMNVKLKRENEVPKRYLIDGGRDVGPTYK